MSQIMCEKMEPSPFHTGLGLRSQRAASTFSRSENLVAPSASAIRMSFPLQIIVPFNAAEQGRRDGQQAELASVWTYLGAVAKRPAVGHFWSHHSHSTSFPPVLHQCHDPHLIWTILSCVLQRNLTEWWNKISFFANECPAHFPFKKGKKKSPQWFGLCCHHWLQWPHR